MLPDHLSLSEFAVLAVLRGHGAFPQTALGERIGLDRTRLSALVEGLEEGGLVIRAPDPLDGRRKRVEATPAGLRALESASRVLRAAEDRFLSPLGDLEREELREQLRRLELPRPALGDLHYIGPPRRRPDWEELYGD